MDENDLLTTLDFAHAWDVEKYTARRRAEALNANSVARIFKQMARTAGLSPEVVKDISGHSGRVGCAQDMAAFGIELSAIMQAGRWKTATMVSRYTEKLVARRGGAAKLAALQNRL